MTTRSEGSSARFHSKAQPIPLHPRRAYLPDPTTSARSRGGRNKPLRVMKFGGSSVADAFCIEKVLDIIQAASCESDVVVVVSAMSGVTNTLIEAAARSESGDRERASAIFHQLRTQHDTAVAALVHSPSMRTSIRATLDGIFHEGDSLCGIVGRSGQLTPRDRDAISSLGERLSAPLVAAALSARGVICEPIEATELVVTDSCHGCAEPLLDATRRRCAERLRPLLDRGVIAVVTGFIGATSEGMLTTLGRGGSDFSATILGSALDADEVIIWTDVDGLMTADPRLVRAARTIDEISYQEAAELAHFGAKVLHPKTLRPVVQSEIPVWIRNTFAPDQPGTRISPAGRPSGREIKAITATGDVTLITINGSGLENWTEVLNCVFRATALIPADVLQIAHSLCNKDMHLVVASSLANSTIESLEQEFVRHLPEESVKDVTLDTAVAMLSVVGRNILDLSGMAARVLGAFAQENVHVFAAAQGISRCNVSFMVAQKDMEAALVAAHQALQMGVLRFEELSL